MDLPFRFNANIVVTVYNTSVEAKVRLATELALVKEIFGPNHQIHVETDGLIEHGFKKGLLVVRFTLDLEKAQHMRWFRDVHYNLLSSEPGIWLQGLGDEGMDLHLVEMCPVKQFRFAALHCVPV